MFTQSGVTTAIILAESVNCCFVVKSNGAKFKRELKNTDSFPRYKGFSKSRTVERNSKPTVKIDYKVSER